MMFGRLDRELSAEERADLETFAANHRKFVDQVMADAGVHFARDFAKTFGVAECTAPFAPLKPPA